MTEYTPHPLVEDGYPMAPTLPDHAAGLVAAWLDESYACFIESGEFESAEATAMLLELFRHANPDARR